MPEDRSDWVAVAPESRSTKTKEIKKAQSAYQFFQKAVGQDVKAEIVAQYGSFDLAALGRAVRERWQALQDKSPYEQLAREDAARFARESHQADIEALQRRERLQQERASVMLLEDDEEDGEDDEWDEEGRRKRTTRRALQKKQKKKARKEQKAAKKNKSDGVEGDFEEESEESSYYSEASDSDQEEKKKKKAPPRPVTQKQLEHRKRLAEEKQRKESYIAERQQDLRKEKATQAKRRLEFLLQQSNIFTHFGRVKEDTAKYGIKTAAAVKTSGGSRRQEVEEDEEQELEEADEHAATYLTTQPSTLGHGQMRDYQLEGLNWMIRLQENGVNGILADEMGLGMDEAVTIPVKVCRPLTLSRSCRQNASVHLHSGLHERIPECNGPSLDCRSQEYPEQLDE